MRLCALILILSVSVVIAQESWWDPYDQAMPDIKAKNWSLAEQHLKMALKQHPNQSRKIKTYGVYYIRYIPEYYLGLVYFNEGRYSDAAEKLLSVQNAGLLVPGDQEFPELTRM